MESNRKKVLVTGAAGFIGANLVKRLVNENYEVYILLRPTSDLWRIKDVVDKLKIHYGDLTNLEEIKKILQEVKPTGIFHLAASIIMHGVVNSYENLIKDNILGTVNLVNAANEIDYEFFINTGTFFEYGPKDTPLKETDMCEPAELYSISKLACTLYCQTVARAKNKPIITFRFVAPFGPYIQKGRLIYNIIVNALQDKDIALTQPEITRDYIYVDDIVDLYLEAAGKAGQYKGEVFNLGSGAKITVKHIVDEVLKFTDSKSKVLWNAFPEVKHDGGLWQTDMSKTFLCFSWRPKTDIDVGLEKMTEWLKNNLNFYQ